MKAREIQEKFLGFFTNHDHLIMPQIPLVPENDPTLLFTSAGMVAFKPYFLGLEEPPHPRLANIQRCLRTTDIDRVGQNARTLSFFEMLGSWSIGDYFKEEAINLAWQFLTKSLGFAPDKLWATYFASDPKYPQIPPDQDSAQFWQKVGMNPDHIVGLGYKDNFWHTGGVGPCGPSTEVYLDRGESFGCGKKNCRPGCDCDRFLEIWNAGVFMQYNQTPEGEYQPLPFNSVDTGAGLERLAMVLQNKDSVFATDLFAPLIDKITSLSESANNQGENSARLVNLIADHIRASVFLLADGVLPANQEQGYILRRLIRRAIDAGDKIGFSGFTELVATIVDAYQEPYSYLVDQKENISQALLTEEANYRRAIGRGKKEIIALAKKKKSQNEPVSGKEVFYFIQTFGLQPALVKEEFVGRGVSISQQVEQELAQAKQEHRQISHSDKKFKGGLADDSGQVIAYHTATHLLHQALRQVLGDHVRQAGSNITDQRLRFDFFHPGPLTKQEKTKIERIVNEQIKADLPVSYQEKSLAEAKEEGALAFFADRYQQDRVRVYKIGDFSQEVCGGPHLERTGKMGRFSITKEQSVGSGKRRIYGILN